MELKQEEMEKISGGAWNLYTITAEERAEYDAIGQLFIEGQGSSSKTIAAYEKMHAFMARMDEKYGPNH